MKKEKPRLGFISVHPAPYREPVLSLVHSRGNIDLEAIILFEADLGHAYWQLGPIAYPHISMQAREAEAQYRIAARVLSRLVERKYDVLAIPGYYYLACDIALGYCILTRTPFVWMSDACQFKPRPRHIRMLKWPIMMGLVNLMGAAWVPGKAGREFLLGYGARTSKIFEGLYTLDTDSTFGLSEEREVIRARVRSSLGVSEDQIVLLMVANLEPKRGIGILLQAIQQLLADHKELKLLLIGEGQERNVIQKRIEAQRELGKCVRMLGAIPFEALTGYYLAADAYVHSSVNEEYSVAVAQAAICGRPIIATDRVGAAYDYVVEGITGALAKAGDPVSLASAIERVISDRTQADMMGMQAQDTAKRFSAERAARQLETAVFASLRGSYNFGLHEVNSG